MANLAVHPPALPTLATTLPDTRAGLHRIFCVGRNYAEHAREMGHDPDREPPFFFSKPASAVVPSGQTIPYPSATADLHFEAELAVLMERGGSDIDPADALGHVWGYACANDLTRRDLQAEAKKKGRPWDMAKGFDRSCILGPLTPAAEVDLSEAALTCTVGGETRQSSPLSAMIWPVPDVIAYLSGLVELQPGDLILTGTPAGVGALERGQTCEVRIDGLEPATVTIAN